MKKWFPISILLLAIFSFANGILLRAIIESKNNRGDNVVLEVRSEKVREPVYLSSLRIN
jgi:hypothetical protein